MVRIWGLRKIAPAKFIAAFKIADRAKHVFMLLSEVLRDTTAGDGQSVPGQVMVAGAFAG